MNELISFLDTRNFAKVDKIDTLKVTLSAVEDTDSSPDKRYYWDGKAFGLHVSSVELNDNEWNKLFALLVQHMAFIRVLYVGNTNVKQLNLASFSALQFLNLSQNQHISTLNLKGCGSLEGLSTYGCENLQEIDLGGCTKFEKIDVSYCEKLSKIIFPLKAPTLRFIKVNKCGLKKLNLPRQLHKLECLMVSKNRIDTFILTSDVPNLSILDVSNNPLSSLPIGLASARKSLESIDLSGLPIGLEGIKFLKDFQILQEVNLSNTDIDKEYPSEVKAGWRAVKTLFNNLQVPFNHVKVLLLGNTNIGKSNLLYYWENNKHNANSSNPSTHGIEYQLITNLLKDTNKKPITLHVWDFGGQEYFHATHKLFFSSGAINLVLWASTENEELRDGQFDKCFELDYWLRCVEQLGFDVDNQIKSDTIVVENKIDKKNYQTTPINQIQYQAKYGDKLNLHYHAMALMPDKEPQNFPKRLGGLNELLLEIINTKPLMRPQRYEDVYNLIKSENKAIVKTNELFYSSRNQEDTILLQVFHNMGLLLYFKDIAPHLIFAKPKAFLDFIYKNILSDVNKWKLDEREIKHTLNRSQFKDFLDYDDLIKIMISFDLVFAIPTEANTFFIPQYLPEQDENRKREEREFNSYPSIIIESDSYLMNLVMLKIFGKFGCAVEVKKGSCLFWNNGIIIDLGNGDKLLIKFNRDLQQVQLVEKKGSDKIDALTEVVEFIISIPEKEINLQGWETSYFQIYLGGKEGNKVRYNDLKENFKLKNQCCQDVNGQTVYIQTFRRFLITKKPNMSIPKGAVYDELVQKLKEGKVVIFIGTGVSAYTTQGNPLATWRGLLEDGIDYCKDVARCDDDWEQLRKLQLQSKKLSDWLHVAGEITDELSKVSHFKTWLRNKVGKLPNNRPELINKIGELDTQIYTTNYDNLLNENLTRGVISNKNADKIQDVVNGNRNEIVHLHGYYDDADTVILGNISYNDLKYNNFFQAIQQAIALSKHILFIGFGAGLDDPNFGPLFEWSKKVVNSEHHHFRLILEKDKGNIPPDPKIQNLVYGSDYDDIYTFMCELVKDVRS